MNKKTLQTLEMQINRYVRKLSSLFIEIIKIKFEIIISKLIAGIIYNICTLPISLTPKSTL